MANKIRKGNYVRVIKDSIFYKKGDIGKVMMTDMDGHFWIDIQGGNKDICIMPRHCARHYVRKIK
jgi:hypothetical protein